MADSIVAALVANPDDPQVRLVYADWLEGRGYPRHARGIRLCVEAERLGGFPEPSFGAASGLRVQTPAERERVEAIRAELVERPEGEVPEPEPWPQVDGLSWSGDVALGGLPAGLEIESWTAFEAADELAEVAPIRYLGFKRFDVQVVRALVGSGWLARLRHLSLHGAHVTRAALKLLVASEDARHLRSIDLSLARLEDGGAAVLAEAPALAGLEALFVYGDRLGDRGGVALARSPYLQNLRALNLEMNYLGAKSAREFLAADRFPHMVHLNLFDNEDLEEGGHVEPLRARWGDLIEI